ncbi:MAG: SUMF1/EgtB/PvdO family nonheme iron enzyme [Bacteroidales bacterium]|nr:SUMF1/EgtB/PvdO family nonheme iron enzyme [Bacteroidales bacterium]
MKKLLVLFTPLAFLIASCSNDAEDLVQPKEDRVVTYAEIELNTDKEDFDSEGTTRSVLAETWEDGSKVYFQFSSGNDRISGMAKYSSAASKWDLEIYGSLTEVDNAVCECYYFENAAESSYSAVTLNKTTAIFADNSATYSFNDKVVKVDAILKPMTGRIRLKGTSKQSFIAEGISFYRSYSLEDNEFVKGDSVFDGSVLKDGFSDYYYGFFEEEDNRKITIHDRANNLAFEKTVSSKVLAQGKSGYLNIPTSENMNGWKAVRFKDFTVAGVSFRMMKVYNGVSGLNGNCYYVGETEVTQELWEAVMQTNPSTIKDPSMPVTNVSLSECNAFISRLNLETGSVFSIPSEAEWSFAAKGGNLSKSTTYCGGNIAADVAWFSLNSNGTPHGVKQKLPNELGLYDMSGNVGEWTNTGSTHTYNVYYAYKYMGGYFNSAENAITPVSNALLINNRVNFSLAFTEDKAAYVGFRLICDKTTLTISN